MTQPPQQQPWNPNRAAGNTAVVVITLIGLLCVLPALICAGIGVVSVLSNGH